MGATGIGLVLAVVLLYFMRLRALLVMGITIGIGLIWTFGLTQLVIGHLNVATGFLVSIVAGNGINVGILYQARYFEEEARGGWARWTRSGRRSAPPGSRPSSPRSLRPRRTSPSS